MKRCKDCYRKQYYIKEYVFSKEGNLGICIVCRYTKRVFTLENINDEIECDKFITREEHYKNV